MMDCDKSSAATTAAYLVFSTDQLDLHDRKTANLDSLVKVGDPHDLASDVMTEDSIPSALDEGIGYPELANYELIHHPAGSAGSAASMDLVMMDHSYCAAKMGAADTAAVEEVSHSAFSFLNGCKDHLVGLSHSTSSTKLPPPEPLPPEQLLASPPRRSRRQMEKSESNEALEQSKEIERIKAFLDSDDSVIFSKLTDKQQQPPPLCDSSSLRLEEDNNKQKRKPGRPPKSDSPLKSKEMSPKKRGRKKKDSISSQDGDGEENAAALEDGSSPSSDLPKKKRGRKPKTQVPLQEANKSTKFPHGDDASEIAKSVLKVSDSSKKTSRRTSVSFSSVLESSEPALFSQPDVMIKISSSQPESTTKKVTVEALEMPVLPSPKKESPLSLLEALDEEDYHDDDSSDSELPFSQETTLSMKSSIIGLKPTLSAKAKDKLKHLQLKFSKIKKEGPEPTQLGQQEEVKEKRKRKASVKARELSPLSLESEDSEEESDQESLLSEDDPNRLWCICRKPYDDRFMIQCDKCEDWFHGTCVKINKQKSRQIEKDNLEWLCPYCTGTMAREFSPPPSSKFSRPEDSSSRKGSSSPAKKKSKYSDPSKKESSKKKEIPSSLILKKISDSSSKDYNTTIKKGPTTTTTTTKHKTSRDDDHPSKKDSSRDSDKKRRLSQEIYKDKKDSFSHRDLTFEKKHKTTGHEGNKEKFQDPCINLKDSPNLKKLKNIGKLFEGAKPSVEQPPKPPAKPCPPPPKEKKEPKMIIPELPPEAKWKELPFKLEKPTKTAPPKTPVEKKKLQLLKEKTSKEKEQPPQTEEAPKASGSKPQQEPHHHSKCIQCKKVEVEAPPALYCSPKCTEDYLAESLASKAVKAKQLVLVDRVTGKQVTGFSEEKVLQWLKDHPSYEVSKTRLQTPSSSAAGGGKDSKSKSKESSSKKPGTPIKEPIKPGPQPIRYNVKKCLKDGLLARCQAAGETNIGEDKIQLIANHIEQELFKVHKDTNTKYKAKYRSLMFNIKDTKNEGLFQKIVKGIVAPDKLVKMSSDELASKELSKWRERENQHALEMIKKEQEDQVNLPLIKKTHKGEVEIDDGDLAQLQNSEKIKSEDPLINFVDTTSKHKYHLFDLNCKICSGKIAPTLPEEPAAKKIKVSYTASSESVVPVSADSPTIAKEPSPEPSLTPPRREEASSTVSFGGPPPPAGDASPPPDLPSAWKGFIDMPEVSKFMTTAHKVSGPVDHLVADIPEKLSVCGRIAPDLVWEYLTKIKQSGTKELIVVRFHPVNEEEKLSYLAFYHYLHQRKRYGVVGNSSCMIKDFYLLPLASFSPIPTVLLPFDGPGLDSNRPPLLLGVLVRHRNKPRAAPPPPIPIVFKEEEYDPCEPSYTPPQATAMEQPPQISSPAGLPDGTLYTSPSEDEAYDPSDTLFSQEVQQPVVEENPASLSQYFGDVKSEDVDRLLTEILQSADPPGKATSVISELVGHQDPQSHERMVAMFTQQIEDKKRQLGATPPPVTHTDDMEEEDGYVLEEPPQQSEDTTWHSSPSPPAPSYHHRYHHRSNNSPSEFYRRNESWSRRPRFPQHHDRHYDHRPRKHWRNSEGGQQWRRRFKKHEHRRHN